METGEDSNDSLIEVTPLNTIRKIEEKKKKIAGELPDDTETYILHVRNLPRNCTPEMIVSFFDSHTHSKRVTVHLGEAGVIIQHEGTLTYAFVLFQSFDRLNLGLLKNGQTIGDETVQTDVISLFEAMILGCNLRRKFDVIDDFERCILLKNLPESVTYEEVANFLKPYDIWLDKTYLHHIVPMHTDRNEMVYRMKSELAAFFIYMKKNWSPLMVNGIEEYIEVSMVSSASSFKNDDGFPPVRKHYSRPLKCENIVCRPHFVEYSSAIVTLKNLPYTVTDSDIADIFRERVEISCKNISSVPVTRSTMNVSVLFESKEEGEYAVDDIRSFTYNDHIVTVHLTCITDA